MDHLASTEPNSIKQLAQLIAVKNDKGLPVTAGLILEASVSHLLNLQRNNDKEIEVGDGSISRSTTVKIPNPKMAVTEKVITKTIYGTPAVGLNIVADLWAGIEINDYNTLLESVKTNPFSLDDKNDLTAFSNFITDRTNYNDLGRYLLSCGTVSKNNPEEKSLTIVRNQVGTAEILLTGHNYASYALTSTVTISAILLKALENSFFINVSTSVMLGALRKK
jgi:hypothetical protein